METEATTKNTPSGRRESLVKKTAAMTESKIQVLAQRRVDNPSTRALYPDKKKTKEPENSAVIVVSMRTLRRSREMASIDLQAVTAR